jgi:elongation factor G
MTREHNKIFLRETVQGSANGEGKIVRQRGARPEYAHVRIGIRPAERGRGVVMAWDAGPSVPAHFANSVLVGIQDALTAGAAGLEVTDVSVTVEDGSYHDADSNEEAFREAAQAATLQAIQQAGPIVLEAMSLVMITLPANQVEIAELAIGRSGGEATPAVPKENGFKALAANVPAVAVSELIAELLSATGGNMTISSRANGFRPRLESLEGGARGMAGVRRR